MPAESGNITVTIELPQDELKLVEAQAAREHRSIEDVIPSLLASELRRREAVRLAFTSVSKSYRKRLAAEGKLDQTADEALDELRSLRELLANELYP